MRIRKKLIALVLSFCMALSLMGLANAATAAPSEDEVTAKALAEVASHLRLSVYELQVKAGETYDVRIIPQKLAQMFGWEIGEVLSSSEEFLSVANIDQETLTITFKGEKTGGSVKFDVEMKNPVLEELVEANPALAVYTEQAQKSLEKTMACKVATTNTETKAVKGVDAGDSATATPAQLGVVIPGATTPAPTPTGPSNSGGGTTPPPVINPGPSEPDVPDVPDTPDTPDTPDDPGEETCKHPNMTEEDATCPDCGAKNPDYVAPVDPDPGDECEHEWKDGVCSKCEAVCDHDGATTGTCKICGKVLTTPHEHTWEDGVCTGCELVCNHGDTKVGEECEICGMTVEELHEHVHDWSAQDGTCKGAGDCPGCPDAAKHADILTTAKCGTCGAPGEKDDSGTTTCPNEANHKTLHEGVACDGESCDYVGKVPHTYDQEGGTKCSCGATKEPDPTYPKDPSECTVDHSTIAKGERCDQCGTEGTKEDTGTTPEPAAKCENGEHVGENVDGEYCDACRPDGGGEEIA